MDRSFGTVHPLGDFGDGQAIKITEFHDLSVFRLQVFQRSRDGPLGLLPRDGSARRTQPAGQLAHQIDNRTGPATPNGNSPTGSPLGGLFGAGSTGLVTISGTVDVLEK